MRNLKKAIEVAGGYVPLAEALKVHPRTIRGWLERGGMPPRHVVRIRRLYGIEVQGNALDAGGLPLFQEAIGLGFTVEFIRKKLGVTKPTIKRWQERGRITDKVEEQIMDIVYGKYRRWNDEY